MLADIREKLGVLPMAVNIGQPISHRLDHMLSGVRAQIAVKIFGDDLDGLTRLGEDVRRRLASIPGLVDLQVEKQARVPQLEINVDYRRAALYGVQPAAVIDQLQRLSNGKLVSRIADGVRRFDIVERLDDRARTSAALADLLIETPYGWVPVRQVAEVRETDGPNQILRENGQRRIVVFANAAPGADMARIVADIRAKLAAEPMPKGFFTSLEGTFQAQEEASRTIGLLSLVSLAPGLCAALFALSLGRVRRHHHGQRSAGPDRQRRRFGLGRAKPFRRLDDRLHHPDRHRRRATAF